MNPAARRSGIGVWWRAVRAYSFPASVVPVLVGAALALERGDALWGLFPVVLLCSVLFLAGTNVINDYFDFVRGVDVDDPKKPSEKPHERANRLAIKRVIAAYMNASPLSGTLS